MRRSLLAIAVILGAATTAAAQTARVAVPEENFRAEPGKTVIASLLEGTPLTLGEKNGQWREATLEAWIWRKSVGTTQRDGFDLVVQSRNGENLRDAPNGRRLARAREGMLLEQVEVRGEWVRVRRRGWIWEPSLAIERTGETAAPNAAAGTADTPRRDGGAPATRTAPGTWQRLGALGATLLSAPDGDTLATLRPMTSIEVVAREGNWVRVRAEGWVWSPALAEPGDTSDVLRNISTAQLTADPDGFRGRVIEWTLRFIALERAEAIRTDFYEGEPFILARGPGDEPGFVYIAVPPDRLERLQGLTPLQTITVLARIRTARSQLMGAPVLDLIELR